MKVYTVGEVLFVNWIWIKNERIFKSKFLIAKNAKLLLYSVNLNKFHNHKFKICFFFRRTFLDNDILIILLNLI